MKLAILFIFIILASDVSALCNETQIDINNATLKELDKIIHVGNATAWKIINLRPFNSVDELVNISGISAGYILDIKIQGLACVSNEILGNNTNQTPKNTSIVQNTTNGNITSSGKAANQNISANSPEDYENSVKFVPVTGDVINLTKDIKSGNLFGKTSYAMIALAAFSVFVAFLFALKKFRKMKNEF